MSSLHYPIEVPKYCAICQKGPFSSGCNAQAHFTSIQHKEAEKSKQSSTNHQFFCKVCSEQCNGPKSFMEHMASPRHKVRQEKSQQFQMSAEREETHDRPYDFDGKRGYCYICRVDLTSKESASQHLNGDNHRKKLQQSQSCKQSNNNCNACRITFPNDDSAEQHFISVHQKSRSDPHSSLNMSMNLRESFGACLIPEEKPQSDDELDKLFQNFQVDLQNETPPQSVIENLQRHSASGSRPFEINSNRNKDVEYTFSISRGFCNVCQVDLTSIKHRDQHLSGVKHNKARQSWLAKRKGNVQNVSKMKEDPVQPMEEPVMSGSSLLEEVEYIFEGGQGFCNVCKLELSSIEHASEHLNSTKHKNAKEDWIQQDVSLSINHRSVDKMEDSIIKPHPFLQTSHITQKSPTVTTTSTVSNSPLFPLPSTPDKPGYVFTGNRGYCNICSLELTSKQHADQHLSGAKHLKAKAAANVPLSPNNPVASQIQIRSTDIDYTFEGSRGFCYICNLELTSKLHANQHLSGAKHNKAKNATQGLTPNLANVSKKLGRTERADPERGNQEYTFNGSKGYCNVCKIELTSKSYAENHLHGKPHNKARQRWMQGYRENVALFCEVCRIPCSGPESMQQHLASKKHKDRVEVITGEVKDSPIGTSDNTKWFFCDICKCKLNSQQQLEAHQQSPKHTAQEEKLLKQGRSAVTLQNVDTTYEGINPTYRQSGQNYDYTGNQMQGYLNDFQKRNTYESRFVNNNAGPSENQFNQYVGNYLQMSPNVEGNVNMMPSYVKPLQNILDRSPLPPNIELPKPSVLSAKRTVKESMQVNFAPPSNEIENLPPFDSFNPSLGSALTLGSLRHGDSFFKVDDERSMIEMARPNVLRTDSMENDMAVEIAHGVNSYHNLDFKQTNLKSSIPMIDNLPIKIRRNNVDTDTAESVNRENISESTAFKSAIDEITSKLSYHHRGHPDGGDSDDEDTNHSSEIFYKKSSFNSKQCEKEIIVPEITTDVVPMNGDSHFIVDDPAELMSSSDNSSHSRKSANTDMSRAIKNRHKSKPSQVSLSSQTDSSIERISENQSQISLSSQTDTSIESSESENFYSGVIKNVFHSDSNNKNNNENEPLKVEENLSDRSIKSPGTSLENTCNLTSQIAGTSGRNPDSNSPYLYYCQTCKRPMNTEKIYKEHVRGQRHLDKVAVESAPDREHPPIKSFNDYGRIGFNLTNTKPRSYQIELFSKTLECDRVCFLPTGTGKTLISCMTISAMLKQNPTRQVMFLVDKVLLVLQQSQYIKKEIGDREYERLSVEDPSKLVKRKPLVAALCAGSQNTGGIPVWKHDVIVVTAAYYSNLLLKRILRWEDNCLIVFDEAHHCIKNHPFNQLLQGYHRKYPQNLRPKLLGLTASPAGRSTVQETVSMLHQLIDNLGGAMIALVEENTDELKKFQSNATIEIHYTTMTRKEKSFKEELQIYLLNCYTRLCEETDLLRQFDLGLKAKKHLTAEELLECANEIDGSLLSSLEITINMASPKEDSKSDRKIFSRNLIRHTQYICIALNVLIESGVHMAIEELQELMAIDPSTSFEFADVNGLPCARMKDALQTCMNVEKSNVSLHSHEIDTSPQLSKLIEIITRTDYVNWSNKGVMVLVLVKQRETAFKIKSILNSHDAIEKLQLNVEAVVGHGSTSGTEQGMSVAKQKQILENMRKKLYHIVVATAVAEEGIDIPECELVITFNPPSTVTALVQMRGRARKNHSKFIILCNSSKEKDALEDLMMKEKNMIEAAEKIIKEQKI